MDTLYKTGEVGHCGIGGSPAAAQQVRKTVKARRQAVLDLLGTAGVYGLTAEEIANKLEKLPHDITPRLSDLRKAGSIVDSRRRRLNRNGIKCVVWILAEYSEPVTLGVAA